MRAIDVYLGELSAALRGPRHAKADLLSEAREGLMETAEAYVAAGMSRLAAERQAAEEFGAVTVVAPGYQEELTLVQARRTSLLALIGVGVQPLVWDVLWPLVREVSVGSPTALQAVLSELVEWLGGLAIVGAAVAVIACGIGVRLPVIRHHVVKATGMLGLAVAIGVSGLGLFMTALSPDVTRLLDFAVLPWLTAFVLLPMAWVGRSARRCLRIA
ncbi:MAG: hypothetical protein GEU81_08125 [Nitriliruptorales bacterium]|nr:hypothetical protein [Nitriliruptorales bacterium]